MEWSWTSMNNPVAKLEKEQFPYFHTHSKLTTFRSQKSNNFINNDPILQMPSFNRYHFHQPRTKSIPKQSILFWQNNATASRRKQTRNLKPSPLQQPRNLLHLNPNPGNPILRLRRRNNLYRPNVFVFFQENGCGDFVFFLELKCIVLVVRELRGVFKNTESGRPRGTDELRMKLTLYNLVTSIVTFPYLKRYPCLLYSCIGLVLYFINKWTSCIKYSPFMLKKRFGKHKIHSLIPQPHHPPKLIAHNKGLVHHPLDDYVGFFLTGFGRTVVG